MPVADDVWCRGGRMTHRNLRGPLEARVICFEAAWILAGMHATAVQSREEEALRMRVRAEGLKTHWKNAYLRVD
jgi:hypothetical protein